jgi:hypothetical protein
MVEILTIETPSLGDRSYLAHDGTVALVVDPQRDIDRITRLAESAGVRITHVVETHIHNDYITGGLALARATGARYLVNAADPVPFDREPVRDGDTVDVGDDLRVRVVATPGHTFTHLSYALEAGGVATAGRCSTARPGVRTCWARTTPRRSCGRSTPRRTGWPASCPTPPPSCPLTASAASAPRRRHRPTPPPWVTRRRSIRR